MRATFLILFMITIGLLIISCSDQKVTQPQATLQPASDALTLRPMRDFLANQGTYCLENVEGGCDFFHAPVANFLCWCDPAAGVMASVDYAAVADRWLQEQSAGGMSCGTGCRGQILESREPDGTARVYLILETKMALSWVEKGNGQQSFGHEAPEILQGKAAPIFGQSRLEAEFSLPYPGAPIPDLVQMLYAPVKGQEVYNIKFYASARGDYHGKPAILEVVQDGLLNPSPGVTGMPAQVTIKPIEHRGQGGTDQVMN